MTTIKMHNIDVKDREAKPMRNLEAIMLHEQKLAAAEEEVAGESAQQEQAALAAAAIDLAMPAAGPPDTADIVEQLEAGSAEAGSAIDMDDAMQLCSAAELVDSIVIVLLHLRVPTAPEGQPTLLVSSSTLHHLGLHQSSQ
ncbi:TPA: hypothetical protein ACH3X1_014773 [Trebouxia sp. C0004]